MRLAARHRGTWLGLEDCGVANVSRIPGRFGALETARLGEGSPIVMLPGIAGGWRLMVPLARALSHRHEVILIGFQGDGLLAGVPQPDARPADHALDVAEVIARLGLERPAVFGASYGGAVALELAVRLPRSVGSLILTGVEAKFQATLGTTIFLRAMERFPLPRTSPFINQFFNVLHGCRPQPSPLVDYIVSRCWETEQAVVASRLRGLEGFDVSERLWEIDVPTRILAGAKDVVIRPAHQKALASAISDSAFEVVADAGHIGFLTHRADFASNISSFLRNEVASVC